MVPIEMKTIPVIVVSNGVVKEAQTVTDKITLLDNAKDEDTILAVWPGKWRSDTFILNRCP